MPTGVKVIKKTWHVIYPCSRICILGMFHFKPCIFRHMRGYYFNFSFGIVTAQICYVVYVPVISQEEVISVCFIVNVAHPAGDS